MSVMVFFGCMLISFGPSIAIFFITIISYPLRTLLVVIGAFFWLVALLLSSLVWIAVVPLREQLVFSLVFSVIFQELLRFALFKLLDKAKSGLDEALTPSEKASIAGYRLPFVSGFGFGLVAGTFSIVNVLSNSLGPGNVGIEGGSSLFFLVSSFLSNAVILLHMFWNIILAKAYKLKKWNIIGIVVFLHMLVSCISLLNQFQHLTYVSVIVFYVTLIGCAGWAFVVTGGNVGNLKATISNQSA